MLRNAIKGVPCVQTSVPFRNAIKTSRLQKVVYIGLSFSVLAAKCQNGKSCDGSWSHVARLSHEKRERVW